jgi:predicted acyltransferase
MPAITFAGIVTSVIFLGTHRWQSPAKKICLGLLFGVSLLIAGWILTPLGISKIRATPTWSLYNSCAAVLFFTTLYWIYDVRKATRWASFVRPAGSNTLTTYLLPDFWYFILVAAGIHYFDTHLNYAWPGVARCVLFTAFILILSGPLTRLRIRLRL